MAWVELENISINSAEHTFGQVAVQALVDDLQSNALTRFHDHVSNHFLKKSSIGLVRRPFETIERRKVTDC